MRHNPVLQFTLVILVVIALVSVTMGVLFSRQMTSHLVESHASLFPRIIRAETHDHADLLPWLTTPQGPPPADLLHFAEELFGYRGIFRLKFWDRQATVIWSDRDELIGQRFPDNRSYWQALAGTPAFEYGEAEKSENATEGGRGPFLEIYVPVEAAGEVVGVIEIYEADPAVIGRIHRNLRFLWFGIGTGGLVLYILLFLVFYRSYRRQRRIGAQLVETQNVTLYALAYQAEVHDLHTGHHLERTARYVRLLADALSRTERYRSYLTPTYLEDLVKSSPLHDIGKVGVSDTILRKPGSLTAAEFEEMKRHTEYGASLLERAEQKLSFQSFLKLAIQLTRFHHEKWDGSGYPQGLEGEQIPLSARIMALADVYDAMRSSRCYKDPIPHEECVSFICANSGRHFDPQIVAAFRQQEEEFRRISLELQD